MIAKSLPLCLAFSSACFDLTFFGVRLYRPLKYSPKPKPLVTVLFVSSASVAAAAAVSDKVPDVLPRT